MKQHSLTAKQRFFTLEYLKDFNATQAAIRAGYSAKTAAPAASRLLRNVKISEEIQKAMRRRVGRLEIHADKVLREIAAHASANIYDYFEIHPDGSAEINLAALSRDSAKGLAEYRITKHGFSIKLTDSLRALELLGEHLGLFAERHEHDFSLTQGIAELTQFLGLDKMSDQELGEARKFLDERIEASRLGSQPNSGQ
jgi:phage terminase small subunit